MDGRLQGGILKLKIIYSVVAHLNTPDRWFTFIPLLVYY